VIRAVLLIGPTGSGKSPQGALLERSGGFRHFDFGAELRAAAAGCRGLSKEDALFVRRLLAAHALLPDERFDLAEQLLRSCLDRTRFDPLRERLVLNGLPRHVGQARALEPLVRVEHVVVLDCAADAAHARVARRRRGEGLDHAARPDDAPEAVARKLALFAHQTAPLVAHYQADPAVRVTRLPVAAHTDDAALHRTLRQVLAEDKTATDEHGQKTRIATNGHERRARGSGRSRR